VHKTCFCEKRQMDLRNRVLSCDGFDVLLRPLNTIEIDPTSTDDPLPRLLARYTYPETTEPG